MLISMKDGEDWKVRKRDSGFNHYRFTLEVGQERRDPPKSSETIK